jgi:hypothetical protein
MARLRRSSATASSREPRHLLWFSPLATDASLAGLTDRLARRATVVENRWISDAVFAAFAPRHRSWPHSAKTYGNLEHGFACRNTDEFPCPIVRQHLSVVFRRAAKSYEFLKQAQCDQERKAEQGTRHGCLSVKEFHRRFPRLVLRYRRSQQATGCAG